jgi:hypothetical protein
LYGAESALAANADNGLISNELPHFIHEDAPQKPSAGTAKLYVVEF